MDKTILFLISFFCFFYSCSLTIVMLCTSIQRHLLISYYIWFLKDLVHFLVFLGRNQGHAILKCATLAYWSFRAEEAWTSFICLKTDTPKETQLSYITFLEVSSNKEDWLIWGEETNSWHHIQTDFVTHYSIFHLSF